LIGNLRTRNVFTRGLIRVESKDIFSSHDGAPTIFTRSCAVVVSADGVLILLERYFLTPRMRSYTLLVLFKDESNKPRLEAPVQMVHLLCHSRLESNNVGQLRLAATLSVDFKAQGSFLAELYVLWSELLDGQTKVGEERSRA
jgi:hypothetical protein